MPTSCSAPSMSLLLWATERTYLLVRSRRFLRWKAMKRGYKRSYRGYVLIFSSLYIRLADYVSRIRNLRLRRSERGKQNSSNFNERRCPGVDAPVPLEHRLIQPTLLPPEQQVQALMIVTRPKRTSLLSWSIL